MLTNDQEGAREYSRLNVHCGNNISRITGNGNRITKRPLKTYPSSAAHQVHTLTIVTAQNKIIARVHVVIG